MYFFKGLSIQFSKRHFSFGSRSVCESLPQSIDALCRTSPLARLASGMDARWAVRMLRLASPQVHLIVTSLSSRSPSGSDLLTNAPRPSHARFNVHPSGLVY